MTNSTKLFYQSKAPTGSKLNSFKYNQYIRDLFATKIPSNVLLPWFKQIDFWLIHNGPEWTVERLKLHYTWFQNLLAYDNTIADSYLRSQGVAVSKKGAVPNGFNQLKRWLEKVKFKQKPSLVTLSLTALRIFTCFISNKTTRKQEKKLIENIQGSSPPLPSNLVEEFREYLSNKMKRFDHGYYQIREDVADENFYSFRSMRPYTSTTYQVVPEVADHLPRKEIKNIPYFGVVCSMITNPWLPESVDQLVPSVEMREISRTLNEEAGRRCDIRGRITVLQEPGYKARVVAIPTSWIQYYMTSVHTQVRFVTESLFFEEDCIPKQHKGIHAVCEKLSAGTYVYSVDLSSATDNFPLELQCLVLEAMNMPLASKALRDIAKGPWLYRTIDGEEMELSYTKGQPMGMIGSISLFNLTHLLVLDFCLSLVRKSQPNRRLSRFPSGSYFYVIGDDVVCSDYHVTRCYKEVLRLLNVPISEHKSYSSNTFSEFAGFLACRFGLKSDRYRKSYRQRYSGTNRYAPYQTIPLLPFKRTKEKHITNSISYMNSFRKPPYNTKRWINIFEAYRKTLPMRDCTLTTTLISEDDSDVMWCRPITLARLQEMLDLYIHVSSLSNCNFLSWPKKSTTSRVVLPEGQEYMRYLPNLSEKSEDRARRQRLSAYQSAEDDLLIKSYLISKREESKLVSSSE